MFLGRELMSRREVSEQTAELVDAEVKRVIDSAYERARQTLTDHLSLLHAVAKALLERETLNREDFNRLVRGESLPPRAPVPPVSPTPSPTASHPPLKPSAPPLLGGPKPSPA